MIDCNTLLAVLLRQREDGIDNSVYKMIQCDFAYNSNHMEGSRLTAEQTRMVFGRRAISVENVPLDDILEAMNHFQAFDDMLDHCNDPIDEKMLFSLHARLKRDTTQERNPTYSVGTYKRFENVIGDMDAPTTPPDKVSGEIDRLLSKYEDTEIHDFENLLKFHVDFEKIHPFSDGNGRIGRLLMFKECLRNDIIPFIITDDLRIYYLRGLNNFSSERGWLRDTCLTAQDRFRAKYMPIAESFAKAMEETHISPRLP
ncbi:Fic family protein [Cutibacterium sp.]|uniref:Fic family protein n=1 Tax=Cutibacterium sp. TaxID=1912221 RepID=UPI0026DAE7B7|nr:Fic family protein [Cutibacterium sp.]MDO4411530.1 Fic family protein [Cutibacterium sp.]